MPTCMLSRSRTYTYRNTEHDCFPIVDVDSGGVLVGTILRKCLTVLLKHKAFEQQQQSQQQQSAASRQLNNKSLYNSSTSSTASHTASTHASAIPLVNWSQLENIYPRYPSIDSVVLSADDRKCWIDLRPYINTAPYVINGKLCTYSTLQVH
jgi:chloride channel 7